MKLLPAETLFIPAQKYQKQATYIPRLKKSPSREKLKIALLCTYPPKECGIATFSYDLENSLRNKFGHSISVIIYALETDDIWQDNHLKIRSLNINSKTACARVAQEINANKDLDVVMIQHEFGLFATNENGFEELLRLISKPIVLTFHTVLPDPDPQLLQKVQRLVASANRIIVMTAMSADILVRDYGVEREQIVVIPHGTHLVPHRDKATLKAKYDLSNKKVLSTFGLIGPGKSIETTLDALPKIINEFPEVMFLIIGKTHPSVLKSQGEQYRHILNQKITSNGLNDHVRFINKFLPLDELLEYLQLTDVYLFTSRDPNQAVSGTFSYALSCACPIASTPIPPAVELYRKNACTQFDFGNSHQLFQVVVDLLNPDGSTEDMILNGLQFTIRSAWENSAIAHARLLQSLTPKKLDLRFERPPIDLRHILNMTTDIGIIQFSKIDQPDINSGYTLDDNARALICICQHFELTNDYSHLKLINKYFNYINNSFRYTGRFFNYVDKNKRFTDLNFMANLEDANGRAIWALGYLLSISEILPVRFHPLIHRAQELFKEALEHLESITSPRALAFIIKGLYHYDVDHRLKITSTLANRLMQLYQGTANPEWRWFENSLTYGNAVIPQAMLLASRITGDVQFRRVAKESFDFLLSVLFTRNTIQVISNNGWLNHGSPLKKGMGGEQPIDVAYTILALASFSQEFPNEGYHIKLEGAFDWFLGNNSLNQTVYNPGTGGCFDGLERNNVNLNQGAESTISYLLARMVLETRKTV